MKQKKCEIFISQEKYMDDLLKMFNMCDCKPMFAPMRLNEKLKRVNDDELENEQMYRSLERSLIYLINIKPHCTCN